MKLKTLFAPSDMTSGRPWEKIVIFTVPMLIGNIAQQLYNTVDSIVVGNFIGDNALAAVGSANPVLNLLLVLFIGISVGANVMVSQYFGARQREELSRTIWFLYRTDSYCNRHHYGYRLSGDYAAAAIFEHSRKYH